MPDDALRAKVIEIALEHSGLSGEELLSLLEYEWDRAGLAVADRGPAGDYVRTVVTRVWQQARHHRGTVDVIVGMSVDNALQMAAAHHPPFDQYALVVGLVAASVTRAILDDPDDRSPGGNENRDGASLDGK
jgi:hypothetical protein